jgi:hypothetical protein
MNKVRNYTDKQLLERVKGLPSFREVPKGRWIIGVRSNEDTPDIMDDKFYEFEDETFLRVLSGTTNPGTYYLRGGFLSYNKKGAAVVVADRWYYDVWKFGFHNGKMRALVQRGAKILVGRDGNKNNKSEDLNNQEWGWFGINYHSNTYTWTEKAMKIINRIIGKWSAGCQVINDRIGYNEQMDYYEKASKNGSQKFVSFCLLNEF